MENITNTYTYQELDPDRREIRLLELLPGKPSDKLALKIFQTSLDAEPRYQALSYLWGDPTLNESIQINDDYRFRVTANLKCALQDIRLHDQTVIIWIDAICINQKDVRERNKQVKLMRDIYKSATIVRIWLNIEIDPDSPPFIKFARLSNDSPASELGNDIGFWEPVAKIGKNSYWRRVWVQQEIGFARAIFIQCRKNNIKLESFSHYQRLVDTTDFQNHRSTEINHSVVPNLVAARFPRHQADPQLEYFKTSYPFYKTLTDALSQSLYLEATDPKDKVYGLLNLVESQRARDFTVDYELSVQDVYRSAIELELHDSRSLHFLMDAVLAKRNFLPDMPSWIPDWNYSANSPDLMTSKQPMPTLVDASAAIIAEAPEIISGNRVLKASGILIGTVMHVSDDEAGTDNPIEAVRAWDKLVRAAIKIRLDSKLGNTHHRFLQWLLPGQLKKILPNSSRKKNREYVRYYTDSWQDLLSSIMSSIFERINSGVMKTFTLCQLSIALVDLMQKWDHNDYDAITWQEPYRTLFWDCLLPCWWGLKQENRVFLTDTASFGVVSSKVQVGDKVWFLHRCPMPMVLRPERDCFLVIGPARIGTETMENMVEGWISTARSNNYRAKTNMETVFLI